MDRDLLQRTIQTLRTGETRYLHTSSARETVIDLLEDVDEALGKCEEAEVALQAVNEENKTLSARNAELSAMLDQIRAVLTSL